MLTSGAAKAAAGYELSVACYGDTYLPRLMSRAAILSTGPWCCVVFAVGLLRRLQAGSVAI